MPIKPTIQLGNSILRAKAQSVLDFQNTRVNEVIQDLVDTMRGESLIGIASPQIGESVRIFVTEVRKTPARPDRYRSLLRTGYRLPP